MYLLQEICSEWMAENGKAENQRARIYTIGVSCLREINMDVNGLIKTVCLTVNANDTVDLPTDFMRYSKIGIIGSDGRVYCMGIDNSITLAPVYDSCGNPVRRSDLTSTGGLIENWGIGGGAFYLTEATKGGAFGLGGGNNNLGYYRLDRATNQLWLSNLAPNLGGSIVVEYVADVASEDGDFLVHPFIVQTVKDWIMWKYVAGDRNTSLGEKQMRRSEYFNSLRLSNNRYSASTPEEWMQQLRISNMASVRW